MVALTDEQEASMKVETLAQSKVWLMAQTMADTKAESRAVRMVGLRAA